MNELSDPQLELRKRIAEEASAPEAAPSIFVRATQFFVVPLGIVAVCVGIYLFFTYLVSEPTNAQDLVERLRTGGAVARKHAAHQLVGEVTRQAATGTRDAQLVEPILHLLQVLSTEDREVRRLLVLSLGTLGDRRALEPVLAELRSAQDDDTRAACLDALGALRASSSAPVLINLLDDPSTVVRKYATFNLAAIAAPEQRGNPPAVPEAIPHLRRKLDDPRPEVQWNAATGLAFFLRDPAGTAILKKMVDRAYLRAHVGRDPYADQLVSDAMRKACAAMGVLGDPGLKESLRGPMESDPDPAVRDAARRAMEQIK